MKSIENSDLIAVLQAQQQHHLRHSRTRNALNDLLLWPMAVTWVRAAAKPLSTMPRLIGSPRLRFQDDRSRPLVGSYDVMRFGAVSQVQNR